jgi:hypothetical protein
MRDGSGMSRDAKASTSQRARDVADFQSRWGEFRPNAASALRNPTLTAAELDTLGWMIEVMDRIAPRDVDDFLP